MEKFGSFQILSLFKIRNAIFLLLILTLAISETGCTVWHTNPFQKEELKTIPDELLHYYDYPKQLLETVTLKEEVTKEYIHRKVEFPLNLPQDMWIKSRSAWKQEVAEIRKTDEKEANDRSLQYTNRLDVYLPKQNGKHPAIVISPILGGNMIVDRFAKYFARHGYVAIIVNRKKSFLDNSLDMKQVEIYLRTSVMRIRQAIDWLEMQPEVDPERIGAFGISYGAILHSIIAAIEPRIHYHILAMPAGNLPDLIVNCPDKGVKKLVTKLKKSGWTKDKIRNELKKAIFSDPMRFAPYVPKNRTVVMVALFDRIVGAHRTFALWKVMGRPKLKLIPLGHYGGLLVFPYLEFTSLHLFSAHL